MMNAMNNLADKTCNCDLDPMISFMERNYENIVDLHHDLTTMDERINSQIQTIIKAIQRTFILIVKNMEDIADTKEKTEGNSVLINYMWDIEEIIDDEMEEMQSNLNQAVLKNSAEIDYIEDAMV